MTDWTDPTVIVEGIGAMVAILVLAFAVYQYITDRKGIKVEFNPGLDHMIHRANLVAEGKRLPNSYPGGGYVIEIRNTGEDEAKDVETLIRGKPIPESRAIMKVQKNISTIPPGDSITYRLSDNPTVGIDVSISWTDITGKRYNYEKKVINY